VASKGNAFAAEPDARNTNLRSAELRTSVASVSSPRVSPLIVMPEACGPSPRPEHQAISTCVHNVLSICFSYVPVAQFEAGMRKYLIRCPFLQLSVWAPVRKADGGVFAHKILIIWWVLTGSNRRHSPCKGDALPAELSTHVYWRKSSRRLPRDPTRFAAGQGTALARYAFASALARPASGAGRCGGRASLPRPWAQGPPRRSRPARPGPAAASARAPALRRST
jgi:hypothetical protein